MYDFYYTNGWSWYRFNHQSYSEMMDSIYRLWVMSNSTQTLQEFMNRTNIED